MANILLAQQDRTLRRYFSDLLTRYGHHVTITENHSTMMETIRHGTADFAILISDLGMDDRSSAELVHEVESFVPEMRLIFLSGFSGVGVVRVQHGLLNERIVTKPFHLRDLPEQINHLLATGIEAA